MNTRTIETYQYNELSPEAQAKARNWFREGQQSDNYFAENVEEDARECFKLVGFTIDKVYWSGFSSQGDGACFTGSWSASDVQPGKLKEHAPLDKELHRIAAEIEEIAFVCPDGVATITHSGHYYHARSVVIEFESDAFEAGKAYIERRDAFDELARDCMDWIYDQLEKDYEYFNSDEQVAEAIRSNEYEFTKEGSRSIIL